MTTRQFNESVNAEIRRMTNKAIQPENWEDLTESQQDKWMNEKAQQGEPTSFSAWLESNGDSIEPLDRTEATTQWFDEKEHDCETCGEHFSTCICE